jgi:trehalose/maltose hydrolase-like predicted phosphorylase
MRRLAALVATVTLTLVGALVPATRALADTTDHPTGAGAWVLSANSFQGNYAPTFVGNGYLGVRVPPAGQGYTGGAVPTQSTVAGLYAQAPGQVQQRANVPTWSTLTFSESGGQPFSLEVGRVLFWLQQLDLRDGVVTTAVRWAAPNGHVTDLRYEVVTDRARQYVGVVRLQLTPQWSGTADVTDLFDGTDATLTTEVTRNHQPAERRDSLAVRTLGTGIVATLASQLETSSNVQAATNTPVDGGPQTVGQRLSFAVQAGRAYSVSKYVGVVTSQDADQPLQAAQQQAADAEKAGFGDVLAEDTAAWARLWSSRIDVLGNAALATEVRASEFYLLASTRAGVNWSASPAGLSSNDYSGHIFWDAETWMYPSLLATQPDMALGMDTYRFKRLAAAEANARATGYQGARFPWESALDGTEQIPNPSINTEGVFEIHITADVALAQWQYYLASGDRSWLASRGWPVIAGAAEFWASRAALGADGRWHILHVTGPDEEHPDVNDEVYTNVAAATTLRLAANAADILGRPVPAAWNTIANGLVVLSDSRLAIHPEFQGYAGVVVKQADVTMLQYPWQYREPADVEQHDVDYYVPRTDPQGPSMSDAINSIDTSELATPGCASYTYTLRSVEPFVRDVFDQFSENRNGGAFTFTTGIGGFLQEFLYGYSGMRWASDSVHLSPTLPPQLSGLVLRQLAWQGRRYTVAIGPKTTQVTLDSGPAMPITSGGRTSMLSAGRSLMLTTRRPDLTPTADLARCEPAQASTFVPGADPVAADDGSRATDWQPAAVPSSLTVRRAGQGPVDEVVIDWGLLYPTPPAIGPPVLLRATDYEVQVSSDGRTWMTVASVHGTSTGQEDVLHFAPVRAGFVRLRLNAASNNQPPMLDELQVLAG